MKNYIQTLLLAGLVFCLPFLSKAQAPSISENYIKKTPVFRWLDAEHYVTYRGSSTAGSGKEVVIDVLTGKETNAPERTYAKMIIAVARKTGDVLVKLKSGVTDTLKEIKNPQLSPDSNFVAFTKQNDLYLLNLKDGAQRRVTNDGTETIYNGYSSWVYNEEILGRAMAYRAFWWSPDSKKIAFMRFDDTKVPVHYLTDDSGIHEKQIQQRYPLPGDFNPEVKIGIATVYDQKLVWADYDAKKDQYFGAPVWTPRSDALWVQWMNRGQDTLKVEAVNLTSGKRSLIYTETQKTWISLDDESRITFVPNRTVFLLMSDKDGWMHLYANSIDGKTSKQITKGNWTVTEINYIDEKTGAVFFTAKKENSTRLDLYRVNLNGTGFKRLTFGEYMHRFELSPNAKYFITTYGNATTPTRVALLDNNGKMLRELFNSKGKDYDKIAASMPKSEIIRVKSADGLFDLPVRITFPAKFDPSQKYALIANVYGGPNSAFVSDGFIGGFYTAQDTVKKNLIRIQMDHRGSGQFGKVGQNYMFRDLGYWEIEDFKSVINYLKIKYPCIDTARVGIQGFSYGGYISAMALLKAPDVFNVALAGGSVTDWHLYDSVYTERYMDTPKDNPKGYQSSSLFTYAKNLKGHLSLAQGTMDDNVHMRNTIKLIDALQEARKAFEVMFYPGAAHGWYYLPNKSAHYNQENNEFIKKYLLDKDSK